MKFVAAKCLIGILSTLAISYPAEAFTDTEDRIWYTWTTKWIRHYSSPAEEERRKTAFFKNDHEIQEHNNLWFNTINHAVSHYEIANMFSDTTDDEWVKLDQVYPKPDDDEWGEQATRDNNDPDWDNKQKAYLDQFRFINSSWTSVKAQLFHTRDGTLPIRLDWRRRLVVPNFESICCMIDCAKATYAWAVAVTLISHHNIKMLEDFYHHKTDAFVPTIYSIQQLIDCLTTDDVNYKDTNFCKSTALGGNGRPNSVIRAYKHIIMNGLMADDDYRFREGNKSVCSYNKEKAKDHWFTGYTKVAREDSGQLDEVGLMQALAFYGPLTVSFNANTKHFWRYSAGVLEPAECKKGKTVSMVLVGYGVEKGKRYWLLMAPWGERFGRHGMIKLARLVDNRDCYLATQAIFPTWEGRQEVTSYNWDYWKKLEEIRAKHVARVYTTDDLNDDK